MPYRERRGRARRHRTTVPFGMGTYGSRSLAVGGSAISRRPATRSIAKGKKIAAHLLEAVGRRHRVRERRVQGGRHRQGKPHGPGRLHRLRAAQVSRPGRSSPASRRRRSTIRLNFTYPAGTAHLRGRDRSRHRHHQDREVRSAVDDFGNVINPMIVEGQVHGGIAQGIGQALLENCGLRQGDGQLLSRLVHGLLHAARRRPAVLQGRITR
jgi:carbon-monoxide dehydrogenase large subunit